MKNPITAKRLALALSNANMIPQELSNASGVSKASISQYLNGSHSPSNISSGKMAKILDVNPVWLMGFDVPMNERIPNLENSTSNPKETIYNDMISVFSENAVKHFENYIKLTDFNKKKVDLYTANMLANQELESELNAAHGHPSATADDIKYDNDIMNDENEWK